MSETKHTPGTWVYNSNRTVSADGVPLLRMYAGRNEVNNGPLVAAAPDLLRVAELLVDWLDEEEGAHALCDVARAAIAKAEGRS